MLFNSIDFAIFLPVVFILYWSIPNKNIKLQNILIFVASYVFYGWWDWRFLSLILFSTVLDYTVGILLSKQEDKAKRKILLWISVLVNFGFLGFFKYYNFFVDNFVQAFSFFGYQIPARSLNIILPVGISFYTFQTLSYTIDVYKRKLEPTKDFIQFAAFVSFFPQLVAGPIERAANLMPQFNKIRNFEYSVAVDGAVLIAYGFFKKLVVADRLAVYVNAYFSNQPEMNSLTAILAVIFFSFQIYCDFSGYSDIARGLAKWFGFELMVNFDRPYFAVSFHQFWKKWHISLSSWFKDYLYIPLGGSRRGNLITYRNLLIVFIVSGFWHGARWTFVVWGALHGFYQLTEHLLSNHREKLFKKFNSTASRFIGQIGSILFVYVLVCFAWIFFRADSLGQAFTVIDQILHFDFSFDTLKLFALNGPLNFVLSLAAIMLLLLFDLSINKVMKTSGLFKLLFIVCNIILIIYLGKSGEAVFIYFQF